MHKIQTPRKGYCMSAMGIRCVIGRNKIKGFMYLCDGACSRAVFSLKTSKKLLERLKLAKCYQNQQHKNLRLFFYILYTTITDDKIKSSRLFDIIRSCIFSKINHVNLLTLPLVICQTNYQKLSRLCTQITLK